MRGGSIVAEGLRIHTLVAGAAEEEARVAELLGRMGLARHAVGGIRTSSRRDNAS